jgi:hypothetical protein
MSDPATPAAPAPVSTDPVAPVAEPTIVTEVDIPEDGGFPAPEPEAGPVVAADPADPAKPAEPAPIKKTPYDRRIDTLTAQRESEKRGREEAERRADLYKAMVDGKAPDPAPDSAAPAPALGTAFATPADFQKAVDAKAAEIAAQNIAKEKMDGLLNKGRAEFKDFDDRCNEVARMGAGDRLDFMGIVSDPTIITDGQKLIAQLAENPDEAERILKLPTVQMTAALVKFQTEGNKAAPVRPLSAAPPPIKTIDGVSKGNDEPSDKDNMADYAAKYRKQQAEKLKNGQPARFARH